MVLLDGRPTIPEGDTAFGRTYPELMPEWPVDGDLAAPVSEMPKGLVDSFGENWRYRDAYKKHIDDLAVPD